MLTIGTKDRLLNKLGIRCTILNLEGVVQLKHIAVESMDRSLDKLIDMGEVTKDQKETWLTQAREYGLAETVKDAFAAVRVVLPDNFVPRYNFVPHSECSPVMHGEIVEVATGAMSYTIYSQADILLNWLLEAVSGPMDINDAAHIFKRAIEQGMPINNNDLRDQIAAIPPDVNECLKARRAENNLLDVQIIHLPMSRESTDKLLRALGLLPR